MPLTAPTRALFAIRAAVASETPRMPTTAQGDLYDFFSERIVD